MKVLMFITELKQFIYHKTFFKYYFIKNGKSYLLFFTAFNFLITSVHHWLLSIWRSLFYRTSNAIKTWRKRPV